MSDKECCDYEHTIKLQLAHICMIVDALRYWAERGKPQQYGFRRDANDLLRLFRDQLEKDHPQAWKRIQEDDFNSKRFDPDLQVQPPFSLPVREVHHHHYHETPPKRIT